MAGIDRDHVVAALGEVFERKIARPHIDGRRADHRDGFHAVEDFADVGVGVAVVVHFNNPMDARRTRIAERLFTLPWRGRVASKRAKRRYEAGWGDSLRPGHRS